MGARTRRGLVLFWTLLFVGSLVLQSAAIAVAPVSAASGLQAGMVDGFEIDGDLKCHTAAGNPAEIPDGTPPPDLIDGTLTNGDDWLDNGAACDGKTDPAVAPHGFFFRDNVDSATVTGDVSPDNSAYGG
ncbi:MAG: hypothetical protein ACJ761_00840, partial [Chloroflexota bacterium]